jgi:hypothetical protein
MADQTDDPHVLAPGHAPTPFTADEIRAASRVGKSVRRLVEDAAGPPYHLVSRYLEIDDAGATMERAHYSLDGAPLGAPQVGRVTWLDLQTHASFPADATTIESEVIDTPIGELDCLRYTVRDGTGEEVFWFAKALPGMPVQQLTRTDGRVVTTVSVLEYAIM